MLLQRFARNLFVQRRNDLPRLPGSALLPGGLFVAVGEAFCLFSLRCARASVPAVAAASNLNRPVIEATSDVRPA